MKHFADKYFIVLLLGALFTASTYNLIEDIIQKEVLKNVHIHLKRNIESINNAPFFRRCGIAWRVLRGDL